MLFFVAITTPPSLTSCPNHTISNLLSNPALVTFLSVLLPAHHHPSRFVLSMLFSPTYHVLLILLLLLLLLLFCWQLQRYNNINELVSLFSSTYSSKLFLSLYQYRYGTGNVILVPVPKILPVTFTDPLPFQYLALTGTVPIY
jgi:hypothetical protein